MSSPGTELSQSVGSLFLTNASRNSHAGLDTGAPQECGSRLRALRDRLPHLNVIGGCCGTDHRRLEQVAGNRVGAG